MPEQLDPRTLIDDLLEVTVVGSFSRIGPAIRRRLFGWTPPPPDALAGRTALVTGPTSGLDARPPTSSRRSGRGSSWSAVTTGG